MCELLGLSSLHPTELSLSLSELARHGGDTGHHADGWGLGWVEGRAVELLRGTEPAATSALVRHLLGSPRPSSLFVAHVRKATVGPRTLANTQPFVRVLGGRQHLFAHNGDVRSLPTCGGRFAPVGDTDSERAWCALLTRLEPLWASGRVPPLEARLAVFAELAAELAPLGPANLLYTDTDALFVHAHRRTQSSGRVEAPGLHVLERTCSRDGSVQRVALVASVPLTDEPWEALPEGTVLVLQGGAVLARL